jgi:hypothetical protein
MKSNLIYTVFAVLFALAAVPTVVRAQESQEYEHPNGNYDDNNHQAPSDGMSDLDRATTIHSSVSKTVLRDSSAAKPATSLQRVKPTTTSTALNEKQESKTTGGNGDDSILSFNFLYYIIQKFKMQDIIE